MFCMGLVSLDCGQQKTDLIACILVYAPGSKRYKTNT